MLTATEALDQLRQGNRRFLTDTDSESNQRRSAWTSRSRSLVSASTNSPDGTVLEQEPFAIVLGCADARVPAEIVFSRGLGDLFVIRVAGNIVAPSQIGSIEFAAEKFGTRLVVVLGHSHCGAIAATLQELKQPSEDRSPNLAAIVNRIRPAIEPLAANLDGLDPAALQHAAMLANVRASVDQLRHGSAILENLVQHDGLKIVGAEYSIESGEVHFLPES